MNNSLAAINWEKFTGFLKRPVGDNTIQDFLIVIGVFILSVLVLKIFKFILVAKFKKITAKTKMEIDDLLVKILDDLPWSFFVLLSLYIAVQFMTLPSVIAKIVYYMLVIVATYYAVRAAQRIVGYLADKIITQRKKTDQTHSAAVILSLSKILQGSLWLVAGLLVLSNMGVQISALIAGLGVGGIAIAFALQSVLEDIFSSISIYFDRPFEIGDFVILGEHMGIIKHIGLKTTRIRTLQGEELVISNRELTSTRIRNYKKMKRRRIVFGFGVTYDTPLEKLKRIPGMVKEIVAGIELATLDRVHFKEFADFSLNFEVVYYMEVSDYVKYMDTQQEINFGLKEVFEKEQIEFAFPTQTLYVNKVSNS